MKYAVIAEYNDAKVTVETNDVEVMFLEIGQRQDCNHLCVCDGTTGEVLMHTGDEPYCTDEFALMQLGWQALQSMDEPEVICESHPEVVCMPGFCPELSELVSAPGGLIPLLKAITAAKSQ
jgi:hypothetical protein